MRKKHRRPCLATLLVTVTNLLAKEGCGVTYSGTMALDGARIDQQTSQELDREL